MFFSFTFLLYLKVKSLYKACRSLIIFASAPPLLPFDSSWYISQNIEILDRI